MVSCINRVQRIVATAVFVALLSFALPVEAARGVPSAVSYQGTLADSGGNPLGGTGAQYHFRFSLWDSPTVGAGSRLWPSSAPTAVELLVRQGSFSVDIGGAGYPDALGHDFASNSSTYLQVEVSPDGSSFETLSPRSLVTSSPFSQVAAKVSGLGQSSFGTTSPFASSILTAQSTSSSAVALTLFGSAGQSANILDVLSSTGSSLFAVAGGGNVGIGTSTPAAALSIAGSTYDAASTMWTRGSNNYIRIGATALGGMSFQTNGQNDRMTIEASGNVGIGTAAPDSLLHAYGTSFPVFKSERHTGASGPSVSYGVFSLKNTTALSSSDGYGPGFIFEINDSSLSGSNPISRIAGVRSGADNSGALVLSTTNAGTEAEKMRITPAGNVGIGTTTPGSSLMVVSNATPAVTVMDGRVGGKFAQLGAGTSGATFNFDYGGYFGIYGATNPTDNGTGSRIFHKVFGNTGNALIGNNLYTTADTNYKLNINAVGSAGYLAITNSSNGDVLSVLGNGNVGIGTSTPTHRLHVVGSTDWMKFGASSANANSLQVYSAGGNPRLQMFNSGGTNVVNIDAQSGVLNYFSTSLFRIGASGTPNTDTTLLLSNYQGTSPYVFRARGNSLVSTADVVIDNAGNVGIGTSTPGTKLSVAETGNAAAASLFAANTSMDLLRLQSTSASGYSSIGFFDNTSTARGGFGYSNNSGGAIGNKIYFYGNSRDLVFSSDGGTTGHMVLKTGGNVGIGTTTPAALLSIKSSVTTPSLSIGVNAGMIGTTAAVIGSPNSTNQALALYGSAGQSAAIFSVNDSTGSGLFSVSPTGGSMSGAWQIGGGGSMTISTGSTGQDLLRLGNVAVGGKTYYLGSRSDGSFRILDNASSTDRLTINNVGNVGVGTSTPSTALDVVGVVNSSLGFTAPVTKGFTAGSSFYGSGNMIVYGSGSIQGNLSVSSAITQAVGGVNNYFMGRVAVGTTTPSARLSVQNSFGSTDALFDVSTTTSSAFATSSLFRVNADGNVGIGTTTPSARLHILGTTVSNKYIDSQATASGFIAEGQEGRMQFIAAHTGSGGAGIALTNAPASGDNTNWHINHVGPSIGDGLLFRYTESTATGQDTYVSAGYVNAMYLSETGNIGLGTTSPSAQLTTTGTVRFAALTGAGSNLVVDALGNVTVSSDERLKDISGNFTRGLEDVRKLSPITYHWKAETGYDTASAYTGFSAQNVQSAIPEAVATSANGFLNLADRPIIAALVNAVKELDLKISSLTDGTAELVVRKIKATELCLDDVCITKDQLRDLLNRNGISGSVYVPAPVPSPEPTPVPEPVATSTPEIVPEPTATTTEPVIEGPTPETPVPTEEPAPEVVPEPEPEPEAPVETPAEAPVETPAE